MSLPDPRGASRLDSLRKLFATFEEDGCVRQTRVIFEKPDPRVRLIPDPDGCAAIPSIRVATSALRPVDRHATERT